MLKSIAFITSASFLAQMLNLAILPIQARIFDSVEMGLFQALITLASLFGAILFFKVDSVILQKASPISIFNIMYISIITGVFTTLLIALLWLVIPKYDAFQEISLLLVLLSAFSFATLQLALNAMTSFKMVPNIAISRVANSLVKNLLAISIGYYFSSYIIITLALILANFTPMLVLVRAVTKQKLPFPKKVEWKLFDAYFRKYGIFCVVSVLTTVLNLIILQLPVFAISREFSVEYLGQYSIAYRAIIMPVSLLSGAVAQVITPYIRDNLDKSRKLLKLFFTFAIFLSPILIAAVFIERFVVDIFIYVFGSNWAIGGEIAQSLIYVAYLSVLTGSFSTIFVIKGKMFFLLFVNFIFMLIGVFLFFFCDVSKASYINNVVVFFNAYYLTVLLFIFGLVVMKNEIKFN
ncbi:oligosaccharide flippase family protein [Pseudoalteromonas xiamenensis]